jgi:hypothetical protein
MQMDDAYAIRLAEVEEKRAAKNRPPKPFEVVDMSVLDVNDGIPLVRQGLQMMEEAQDHSALRLVRGIEPEIGIRVTPCLSKPVKRNRVRLRIYRPRIAGFVEDMDIIQ